MNGFLLAGIILIAIAIIVLIFTLIAQFAKLIKSGDIRVGGYGLFAFLLLLGIILVIVGVIRPSSKEVSTTSRTTRIAIPSTIEI